MPHDGAPPEDRDGMHSGIGGLAHILAEVREARAWTDEESRLADGIAARIRNNLATSTACSYFDGLVSDLGVLSALNVEGSDEAIVRLAERATDDGWEQPWMPTPLFAPHSRVNDATLGTAGTLLGAVWAHKHGTPGAEALAARAAEILMSEGERTDTGTNWLFVPRRFTTDVPTEKREREMPNWSARCGAEHLVTLGDTNGGGFVVPHVVPSQPDLDEVTFTWCHGPTGTSLLFTALEQAGITQVAGETPVQWQRNGVDDDLAFAQVLGDALVERALVDRREGQDDGAFWRFTEHRNQVPLLPPGVGWMQGTAGIAAYLLRLGRVLREGPTVTAATRLHTWWNLP